MAPDSSVVRFLAVGIGNTLAGVAVIFLAKVVGVGDVAANVIGYAAGLTLSFALNRRWTFQHDGPWVAALTRFIAVLAVAYGANLAIVLSSIAWLGVDSYLSQLLGVPAYTVISYTGMRLYVFPQARERLRGVV